MLKLYHESRLVGLISNFADNDRNCLIIVLMLALNHMVGGHHSAVLRPLTGIAHRLVSMMFRALTSVISQVFDYLVARYGCQVFRCVSIAILLPFFVSIIF